MNSISITSLTNSELIDCDIQDINPRLLKYVHKKDSVGVAYDASVIDGPYVSFMTNERGGILYAVGFDSFEEALTDARTAYSKMMSYYAYIGKAEVIDEGLQSRNEVATYEAKIGKPQRKFYKLERRVARLMKQLDSRERQEYEHAYAMRSMNTAKKVAGYKRARPIGSPLITATLARLQENQGTVVDLNQQGSMNGIVYKRNNKTKKHNRQKCK